MGKELAEGEQRRGMDRWRPGRRGGLLVLQGEQVRRGARRHGRRHGASAVGHGGGERRKNNREEVPGKFK